MEDDSDTATEQAIIDERKHRSVLCCILGKKHTAIISGKLQKVIVDDTDDEMDDDADRK